MWQPAKIEPCRHDRHGRYCSKCGLEIDPPRLTFRTIWSDLLFSWLQQGFRQTFVGLLVAPGHQVRHYLKEDRTRLIKPVSYLLIAAALDYWVVRQTGHDAAGNVTTTAMGIDAATAATEPMIVEFSRWLVTHIWQIMLAQAALMALLMRYVFFRRIGHTLAEFTIFLTYVLAQSILLQTIAGLFFIPYGHPLPNWAHLAIGGGYTIFAIAQFTGTVRPPGILRAIGTYAVAVVLALSVAVGAYELVRANAALLSGRTSAIGESTP